MGNRMNPLKTAADPMKDYREGRTPTLGTMLRDLYEPTEAQVADHRQARAQSAEAIRAGIERMKRAGKW
jgi:hypothetical protein